MGLQHNLKLILEDFDKLLRLNFSNDLEKFSQNILEFIAEKTQCYTATFFVCEQDVLQAYASYACLIENLKKESYEFGEGLVGQVAETQERLFFENLKQKNKQASFAGFNVGVSSILIFPLVFNQTTYGVLELTFLNKPSVFVHRFLAEIKSNVAASIESLYNAQKTLKLLEETNLQKEELLAQEEEMRQNLEELVSTQELLEDQKKQLEITYEELGKNHERLIQSMQYAQRIQGIILPGNDVLASVFQEFFIIYLPKDLVSGDFYWYGHVNNYHYIAVVDCTGHGVPGAFMSMIGHTLLNQIILEKHTKNTDDILNKLQKRVRLALKQEESQNSDGMNLVLCRLEFSSNTKVEVQFTGAKTDLGYTNNGKINLLKGDRKAIGGTLVNDDIVFTKQEMTVQKGEMLYLITDGVLDICNPSRKRFSKKRFFRYFEENHQEPSTKQKEGLVQEMTQFQQGVPQRDDITVLGLRL